MRKWAGFEVCVLRTIGLLQWGRNFIVAEIKTATVATPATGMLQWGRNFIVAEIKNPHSISRKQFMLQWGRNFIVAEIRQR